jgi:hypothetical protein
VLTFNQLAFFTGFKIRDIAKMGAADIKDPFTPEFSAFVAKTLDQWKLAGISIAVVDGDDVFSRVNQRPTQTNHSLANFE